MKLFCLEKQVQITYYIHLSNLRFDNNDDIFKQPHQKHLGIVLDSKLNFNAHVDQKTKRYSRIISLVRRLSITLPRNALLTIYKSFVRPHLNYGDKPNNEIYVINQTMKIFRTNQKQFPIEPPLQLLVQFKELQEQKFMMNYDYIH